ncbi:hypothetical protein [Tardiphaga alba]|uniref:hypothetical protein n=1 Tax=Tardiphaga alba TaxID=340268 RepID=UPI002010CF5F|nr:hypothetical protein [Tardiphaga alba]
MTLAEEPAPAPKPVRRQVQTYEEAPAPVVRRQAPPPSVDPALPGRFIGGVVGGILGR